MLGIDCVSLLAVFEIFWCLRVNFVLLCLFVSVLFDWFVVLLRFGCMFGLFAIAFVC